MGVIVSYVVAALMGQVDFTPVAQAAWIGLPVKTEDTVFSLFGGCNASIVITSIITIVPISLATIIEHNRRHLRHKLNGWSELYRKTRTSQNTFG